MGQFTDLLERIQVKVERTDSCWFWTACRNYAGYPIIQLNGGACRAHRVIYEQLIGPIPKGLTLDHLCRVRHCVNPAHLEPVTDAVNIARGNGVCAQNARRTHCPQGHLYDWYWRNNLGKICRLCRTCKQASQRRQDQKGAA